MKKFLFLFFFAVFTLLFFFYNFSFAANSVNTPAFGGDGSADGLRCDSLDQKTCWFEIYLSDTSFQAYKYDLNTFIDEAFGGSARIRIDACLSGPPNNWAECKIVYDGQVWDASSFSRDARIDLGYQNALSHLWIRIDVNNAYSRTRGSVFGRRIAIEDFYASPSIIDSGQSSRICWDTTNVDNGDLVNLYQGSQQIDGSLGYGGSVDACGPNVSPTSTTTYTLKATGPSGYPSPKTIDANVTVTVNPPTVNIKANNSDGPISINYNTSATLSWTSSSATSCTASNGWSGGKPLNGSESTGNLTSSKTYTLTCSNGVGSASDSVTVNTSLPPPGSFTLYNTNDCQGNSSFRYIDLDWSDSANSTEYEVYERQWSNGSWYLVGRTSSSNFRMENPGFKLGLDFYYKIRAINSVGSRESNTVFGGQCEETTASINCNGSSSCTISYNSSATINWDSNNAGSCTVSPDGWTARSGSRSTGNLTSSKTYSNSCSGQFNNASANATVNVSVPPAPTVDLRCDDENSCDTVDYGSSETLRWSITNGAPTNNCTASNAWSGSKSTSGSESTGPITSNKTWTIQCSGPGGTGPADSVSATVPAPTVDIEANGSDGPITVSWNSNVTLSWSSSNTGSCSASGDWSGTKALSGSQSTGNLTNPRTYTYTLTCPGNGSASDSVQVVVSSPVPVASNITVTQPDYCLSGPAATTNWDYSDPSGSPQYAYQVQIDDQGSFNSPEVDSGKIICQNCRSYFSGTGLLAFSKTDKARVRVWNTYDSPSGWTESGSWKTPNHAYPNVNPPYQFTWSPLNPAVNESVQFTDRTWFDPSSANKQWSWTFVPAGGGPGSSTAQNPVYTFNSGGIYQVTESVRDNAMPPGQYCTGSTQAVNIQKPIPIWKEVAPR